MKAVLVSRGMNRSRITSLFDSLRAEFQPNSSVHLLVLLVLSVWWVYRCVLVPLANRQHDFSIYLVTSHLIASGKASSIYDYWTVSEGIVQTHPDRLAMAEHLNLVAWPYLYPPILPVLLMPLSLIPTKLAEFIWIGINLAAFLLVIMTVRKIMIASLRVSFPVSLLVALFLLSTPIQFTMLHGNIELIVFALTLLAFYLSMEARSFIPGALLGIATVLKVAPGLMVIPLLTIEKRRKEFIMGFIFSAAMLSMIGTIAVGPWWIKPYLTTILPALSVHATSETIIAALYAMISGLSIPETGFRVIQSHPSVQLATSIMRAILLVCLVFFTITYRRVYQYEAMGVLLVIGAWLSLMAILAGGGFNATRMLPAVVGVLSFAALACQSSRISIVAALSFVTFALPAEIVVRVGKFTVGPALLLRFYRDIFLVSLLVSLVVVAVWHSKTGRGRGAPSDSATGAVDLKGGSKVIGCRA